MARTSKPIIHCDALVVHCMDYRLQKFLQPWITVRFGYDNFDIISLAGQCARLRDGVEVCSTGGADPYH